MTTFLPSDEARPLPSTPRIIWLITFLDLMGVLFAFFVLLYSMSSFEDLKTSAVRSSLNSAFASILPPSTDPTPLTSVSGRYLGSDEFQGAITRLFGTAIGVDKIEIVQPGSIMRVAMAADSLFLPGETTLREANLPLVDRMIASLSGRPPGFHFDMEFVIGVEETGRALPVDQTLQMARAGAFVRELLARGVPPDTIAIGVRKGRPDQIVMWFYVRAESDVRSFYRRLLEPKEGAKDGQGDG
jgi:flagellar motor protein MotB